MTTLLVAPAPGPLAGRVTVPGDKSIGHRAVIFAGLGDGPSTIRGLSGGEDNQRTLAILRDLGIPIATDGERLLVEGRGLTGLTPPPGPLDCGNSGTSMRLLAGLLAAQPFPSLLVGDRYLQARPMARVALPLRQMGATVEGQAGAKAGELYPPLRLGPQRGALRAHLHRPAAASAQVKSALLLAGLWADGVVEVIEPARSRDHSERMLAALGVPLVVDGTTVRLDPRGWVRRLPPRDWLIPGDLSAAAFLLAAAALVPGSELTVQGVGINPSRTGFLDVLAAMGGALTVDNPRDEGGEPVADLTARGGRLHGVEVAGELALRALDELPLIALLAAAADGRTVIRDAAELRVKESDRLAASSAAIRALGGQVEELADGLIIDGGALTAGVVESHGDHRIAMATAVAALAARGAVRIHDVDNIATSFPGFAATLREIGGAIEVAG